MFSVESLIMISAITFCVGGLLGAIISRSLFPPEQQKALEESLKTSKKELDQYQKDVSQHFADTASLVNNLTQSYKQVHDHLATGALQLTNPEITRKILESGDKSLGIEAPDNFDETFVEPPRDWAPKSPGGTGTLSEEFGLNDHLEDPSTSTAKTKAE